ncbi:hypothetical protein SLS60_001543 [Paraconiothyrium brasiliense]|uniref:Ubiquitin-protein ligase E3A N-terminal zinc-binding domain-containing protein n=1 Tax=Paraconiothyrium brasiliense TaxID=300254 RepID=A0ABR3RZM8_9PLEO
METEPEIPELAWSTQLTVAYSSRSTQLPGDKIILPPSALEQLLAAAPVVTTDSNLPHVTAFDPYNPYTFAAERQARSQFQDRHQQLPHPLTFRLVNPSNGRVVYAGIREFSAEEGEIVLSAFLREALGLDAKSTEESRKASPDGDAEMANGVEQLGVNGASSESVQITVHAKQLPKGTFVKLRPLEAGYDPEDWKSLLEEHLRSNFTTLTNGEVLIAYGGRASNGKREEFRFLVDGFKPEGDGICVVDTDLEVDIEALNEEQARETLKKIIAKRQKAPGTAEGSSAGGEIDIFKAQEGQILDGEYVDYVLSSWDRSQGLDISLSGVGEEDEIDLFVSPYSSRQQVRPRVDEHVFADCSSKYPKRIRLQPTNVELEVAEAIYVSVRAFPSTEPSATPKQYQLKVTIYDPRSDVVLEDTNAAEHRSDEVRCKNCHQWVPKSSLFLHENFCLRNNILCPQGCGQVFQKRSENFKDHWHCPHDTFTGDTSFSHSKHEALYHTSQVCPSCDMSFPSIPTLALHRVTECPGKLILCRFCHLQVPQEGDPTGPPNPELLLSGLTPHELADGGRTTECHLCSKIVRFRDMDTHLKHHDLERLSRHTPRLCRNVNCGRTQDGTNKLGDTRAGTRKGQGPGNEIGLCSVCFGPLYVSLHDPDGKALRRRIERRYLSQLLTGCGRAWCKNEFCRTGRKNASGVDKAVPTKDAIPLVKPFLGGMDGRGYETPLHFCTDEASHRRRALGEMLSAEKGLEGKGGYSMEWCVAALEAEGGDLDKARGWLKGWAPQRTEASS